MNWKYEFLYIPFFLPFAVVSLLTIAIYFRDYDEGEAWWRPFADAADRVSGNARLAEIHRTTPC